MYMPTFMQKNKISAIAGSILGAMFAAASPSHAQEETPASRLDEILTIIEEGNPLDTSQLTNTELTDEEKAKANKIKAVFEDAKKEHDIYFGPQYDVAYKRELYGKYYLEHNRGGLKKPPYEIIDEDHAKLNLGLSSFGFNHAVLTCPSEYRNTYLDTGVTLSFIFSATGIYGHMDADRDTELKEDEDGKIYQHTSREFSYIVVNKKLVPLKEDSADEAAENLMLLDKREQNSLAVNKENLDVLAGLYKDVCTPKF
jgi:hypothetical protein